MGQREIIKALAIERKCNNSDFLTPKDIKKALENIGFTARMENISKNIRKIKSFNQIETVNINKKEKAYRLKEEYKNIDV